MDDNWFLEGLKWDAEEFEKAKNNVSNGQATEYEILKVWGRLFFEQSDGKEYVSYLRGILPGSEAPYTKQIRFLRQIGITEQETRMHCPVQNWFLSHCWMIKGKERGRTSRLPRNLLYCIKENNFDPDDEHFTDEYFIRLLSDAILYGLLRGALQNLGDYPLLDEAIQRFKSNQNRISGSAGWYLRVNGNEAKLALGITNVEYPDQFEGEKWVNVNGIISMKISDGDSVFFPVEQINNKISPEEELKPKFGKNGHGQEIEVIDTSFDLRLGKLERCLEENRPLFFQIPSNPQLKDYRSIDFTKTDNYHRRFIWIVAKKRPVNNNVRIETSLQLMGHPSIFCWKCELKDIDNEVRSFIQDDGNLLFKYQLRQTIKYSGFDEELCDASHEWSIFTGDSATLTSPNNDEWNQNCFDTMPIELSEDRCSCTVKASNEIFALRLHTHRKDYKILHIPQMLKEKIRNREKFENGAWSYLPNEDEHIDKLEHINRYRIGTLMNNDRTTIPIHCDMPKMQPIAWIEPGREGFEKYSAVDCSIPKKFGSYSDLAEKYLRIASVCNDETIDIKHSDGSCEEKTIQPGKDGTIQDEISNFMKFKGTIDQNACDTLYWRGQEVLTVRCCPSEPALFKTKDAKWHLYVPRDKRKGYQVFFLSEKFLETPTQDHFSAVPCNEMLGEGNEDIVELKIPDSLPKEYAVHACVIPGKIPPNVLNMENHLEKVREATSEGAKFDNPAILSILLDWAKFDADFADARRYVAKSPITPDAIESFWRTTVGKISPDNPSEDIVFCMNQMLLSGYNFLCEPLSSDDRNGDYGKTWLSTAFEELIGNIVEGKFKARSFKLDKLKLTKSQKLKCESLLKVILDNHDVKNKSIYIIGDGWLSPICALYLLYTGDRSWAEIDLTKTDGAKPKVQILLEESGIKALTNVANIFREWNVKINYCNGKECQFSRNNYYKHINNTLTDIRIVLPNRKRFQEDQDKKYKRDEVFYSEEVIFEPKEFEKALNLTNGIIEKCQNGNLENARIIGNHLLTLFEWVRNKVKNHYIYDEEDVEHCTLGIIAIACRLVAHTHSDNLISPDEYKFMLDIVKKTFDEKFNTRHDPPESRRRQAAIARWRYLMRCIVSVEVAIAFFNVEHTGKVIEEKDNWR